jgi:micrococcal nuclease
VKDDYTRGVTLVRVVDGDTVVLDIDMGWHVRSRWSCRLIGINAPDRGEGGYAEAKAALGTILAAGPLAVRSLKLDPDDKYGGRFDGLLFVRRGDEVLLVQRWLIDHGYAVEWNGEGPRPLVPWPTPAL